MLSALANTKMSAAARTELDTLQRKAAQVDEWERIATNAMQQQRETEQQLCRYQSRDFPLAFTEERVHIGNGHNLMLRRLTVSEVSETVAQFPISDFKQMFQLVARALTPPQGEDSQWK